MLIPVWNTIHTTQVYPHYGDKPIVLFQRNRGAGSKRSVSYLWPDEQVTRKRLSYAVPPQVLLLLSSWFPESPTRETPICLLLSGMLFIELFQREPDTGSPTEPHIAKHLFQLCLERRFDGKRSKDFVFFSGKKLASFLSANAFGTAD